MRAWIGIAAVLLLGSGCKEDACEGEPPSFQLDVSGNGAGVRSLVIELTNGAERRRRSYDVGAELNDGMTSIAVDVEQSLVGQVMISARTYPGTDGEGALLQQASGSFALMPNGCNLFSLQLEGGGGPEDAGQDAGGMDVGPFDGDQPDALPDEDAGPMDADEDAGVNEDAGEPDLGVDTGPACIDVTDPNTVALYSMEGDLTDVTGAHDGATAGNASFETGQPTCGQGMRIAGSGVVQGYGSIPDSPAFDLDEGSLDLWMRPAAIGATRAYGVVSRDSATAASGGFTLYMACDGTLVAKLDDMYVCADTQLSAGQWSYVGVNFGAAGFELWVDGVQAARTTAVGLFGQGCAQTVPCGGTSTTGLSGNDNPWILGASADASVEGTGLPLSLPFRDGLIDSLRISDARRAF